ncbi:MAG TPA: hypothetical protein VNR64_12085 [Vicinamibacterales bacterium]|nr:hypothetical protein [Vicinamibacterales bacterium]
MTASAGPALKQLYREYGDRVAFLTVYVREAHPGERYPQPQLFDDKLAHARAYKGRDQIPWTVAVDDIEGSFHQVVDPKPNAAYFVDADGHIVFRALWSNDEAGLRQGFEALVSDDPAAARGQREAKLIPMMRGIGKMDEVLGSAGDEARRDFRRALPPVYGMAKIAGWFRPLPPLGRAIAAMGVVATAVGAAGAFGWRAFRRAA